MQPFVNEKSNPAPFLQTFVETESSYHALPVPQEPAGSSLSLTVRNHRSLHKHPSLQLMDSPRGWEGARGARETLIPSPKRWSFPCLWKVGWEQGVTPPKGAFLSCCF